MVSYGLALLLSSWGDLGVHGSHSYLARARSFPEGDAAVVEGEMEVVIGGPPDEEEK